MKNEVKCTQIVYSSSFWQKMENIGKRYYANKRNKKSAISNQNALNYKYIDDKKQLKNILRLYKS